MAELVNKEKTLNVSLVKELFDYDENTGNLIYKKARKRIKVGDIVGSEHNNGYLQCRIGDHIYYLHRLVWLFKKGVWPSGEIDHINRNKKDNRIENLRIASRSENNKNVDCRKTSITKVKGVRFDKRSNRYVAYITEKGKYKHVASCSTLEEAIIYRTDYAKKLHKEFFNG